MDPGLWPKSFFELQCHLDLVYTTTIKKCFCQKTFSKEYASTDFDKSVYTTSKNGLQSVFNRFRSISFSCKRQKHFTSTRLVLKTCRRQPAPGQLIARDHCAPKNVLQCTRLSFSCKQEKHFEND